MLDCRCLPVHLELLGPCMYGYAVFHIVSLHCSFVFTYPLLQCSSCFSNIDTLAFGAWYLVHDSFLLPLWLGVFVCPTASLRVPFDLKVVLIPRRLHFLSILSLTPLTYGKWRNLGVVCSCSSVQVEEWGAWGRFLRVRFTICAGYPFTWKTCFRWFHSPISLVAWQTFLALVPRHLMMLDLILAWW